MKILTIGRDESCNIVIDDDESLISRRHALLKLYPTGRMEIVDTSSNGTFVNGKMAPKSKPYPVTRKDVVSFARTKQLDWKLVPNYGLWIKVAAAVAALVILAAVTASLIPEKKALVPTEEAATPTATVRKEEPKKEEANGKEDTREVGIDEIRNIYKKKAEQDEKRKRREQKVNDEKKDQPAKEEKPADKKKEEETNTHDNSFI